MNYAALLSLIESNQALIPKTESGDHVGVAADLNAKTIATTAQYQLTTTDVMDLFGPFRGTQIIASLRSDPMFSEIINLMDKQDTGVNINHRDADGVFDVLVTNSVITSEERDQILELCNSTTSLAEQTLGQLVHHLDVARAWARKEV